MSYQLAMNLWPAWILAGLLAFIYRREAVVSLLELSWWHRILGGIAATVYFGVHLGLLK